MRQVQVTIAATILVATVAAFASPKGAFATPSRHPAARASSGATVVRRAGRRLHVRGADVAALAPGMSVWVSEAGVDGRPRLPIVEAKVLFVHRLAAVVELPADAPDLPERTVVEPRYVAEARLYGHRDPPLRGEANRRDNAENPGEKSSEPPFQTWHTRPQKVRWDGKLWLEMVGTENVSAVELRWRVGGNGPFLPQKMDRRDDGMWTAEVLPGKTAPHVREVQYYIVGKVAVGGKDPRHTALRGHPGKPIRVAITSLPQRARTKMVDHEPPGRVSHNEDLILTAQINARFRQPIVYFRARGGGTFDAVAMKRVAPDVFRAVIPARKVVVPGLSYYIAVTDEKGIARDGFGRRRAPHNVHVTRGRILSPDTSRNYVSVQVSRVNYGGASVNGAHDGYDNVLVRFDRRFFGFLVARLGGEMVTGMAPRLVSVNENVQPTLEARPLDLYLGNAGLEAHLGNYFSGYFDTVLGIHNEGAALGYEVGGRIGDEAGANLTVSHRSIDSMEDDAELISRFRAALSAPLGDRLRIAGAVIHEDIGQDASRGLRLQVEASYRLAGRFTVEGRVGMAGRDADRISGTGGLGLGVVF